MKPAAEGHDTYPYTVAPQTEACVVCDGLGVNVPTDSELRLVQIATDEHGLAGLDRDGRVWQHIPGNGWTAVGMNVMGERRGP